MRHGTRPRASGRPPPPHLAGSFRLLTAAEPWARGPQVAGIPPSASAATTPTSWSEYRRRTSQPLLRPPRRFRSPVGIGARVGRAASREELAETLRGTSLLTTGPDGRPEAAGSWGALQPRFPHDLRPSPSSSSSWRRPRGCRRRGHSGSQRPHGVYIGMEADPEVARYAVAHGRPGAAAGADAGWQRPERRRPRRVRGRHHAQRGQPHQLPPRRRRPRLRRVRRPLLRPGGPGPRRAGAIEVDTAVVGAVDLGCDPSIEQQPSLPSEDAQVPADGAVPSCSAGSRMPGPTG